jgi:hypothetical protein
MVILTTLVESDEQLISGRPKDIRVETSVPSNVYYTLDGTIPTASSLIMVGAVVLPTDQPSVYLKYYASNGIDTSPLVEVAYQTDLHKVRFPNAKVDGSVQDSLLNWGPYGDQGSDRNFRFNGTAGTPVDTDGIDGYPNGFDGTGTGTTRGDTDLPKDQYKFRFSMTDAMGRMGNSIGTLPARVTIIPPPGQTPQTTSKTSDRIFDPKALVIYQSYDAPSVDNVNMIQRGMFSLENPERSSNGFNTGFDKGNVTGGYVKAVFNPSDSTINYYYRDQNTSQWIISKEKYVPRNGQAMDLARTVTNPRQGNTVAKVFSWTNFHYSRIW